jgi:hypothetical protein
MVLCWVKLQPVISKLNFEKDLEMVGNGLNVEYISVPVPQYFFNTFETRIILILV